MSKTLTKTEQLLAFARQRRVVRFTDLQRFIVELNGLDYDKFSLERSWNVKSGSASWRRKRVYRGYWCDRFYNTINYHGGRRGILSQYFNRVKNIKGRFVYRLKPEFQV